MPAIELPDRRDLLFGRAADVELLSDRASRTGLTAVVARPQMGKSWLLTELARRLATDGASPCLVGFAESFGESPDLLLRAIVDLYQRWLGDASYWQQAKMVWDQQKDGLLPAFSKSFAKIIEKMGEVVPVVGKPGGAVIREGIEALVAANQVLTSGVQLPTLQYEQARDLIRSVADISSRRVVVFLDQWEKSPNPAQEAKTLDAFLRHLDDWPDCHVFLASLPDDSALKPLEDLRHGHSDSMEIVRLEEMQLDELSECDRLLGFLRGAVLATLSVEPEHLLGLIVGYPGVVSRWTSTEQRRRMRSVEDLERVADDAQRYRFRELEALLKGLQGDQRNLAVRIALLPAVADKEAWAALRSVTRWQLADDLLDDLKLGQVLEGADPPSFGHSRRWEAARSWMFTNRRESIGREASGIILRLAAAITDVDASKIHFASALRALMPIARDQHLDVLCVALCEAAAILFGDRVGAPETLITAGQRARASQTSGVAPLLSIGLFNTLNDTRAEDDLGRRDALLDELRALARTYPDDAAVRKRLAKGLFNTLIDAKAEDDLGRRDALLDELRALARTYPDDATVRDLLGAL